MSGFVLKDAPPEKTLEAIHVVARGDAFIAPAGEDDGAPPQAIAATALLALGTTCVGAGGSRVS